MKPLFGATESLEDTSIGKKFGIYSTVRQKFEKTSAQKKCVYNSCRSSMIMAAHLEKVGKCSEASDDISLEFDKIGLVGMDLHH